MSNPVFPDIMKPSRIYDEEPEDVGMSSSMDDGSTLSRPKYDRSRMTFYLSWKDLPQVDKAILLDFYMNTVKGVSFICDWTHHDPNSEFYGKTFHVRIIDKSFKKSSIVGYWNVTMTLQEA